MASLTESLTEQTQTDRLFFVLSGEHASLPAAEVKAILEASGAKFSRPTLSYRLLTLNAPVSALKAVSERSLMYDWCGLCLGECEANEPQIEAFVKNQANERLTRGVESFAVRSVRLGGAAKSVRRVPWKGWLGLS